MNILLYIVFSKRRGRFRRCRDFIRESLRLRLRVLVARERFNCCSTAAAGAESEPDTLGSGRPRSVERAAPQPRYFTVTFQQPQQYLLTSCLLTHNFLPTHFLAFTQGNLEHISSQIENLLASSQRQKDDMDRLADMMRKQKNTMHMFKEAAGACSLLVFFM